MKKTLLSLFVLLLSVYSFGQLTAKVPAGMNDGGAPVVNQTPSMPGTIQNIQNPGTDAMSTWVLPSTLSTSGNSRIPRNAGVRYEREEFLVLPSEMAASGYPAGNTIDALGFLISTVGVGTQTGQLTIYLMNTTDVTYTLGSTWTTTGFTTVSSDPAFTVPIAAGSSSIPHLLTPVAAFMLPGNFPTRPAPWEQPPLLPIAIQTSRRYAMVTRVQPRREPHWQLPHSDLQPSLPTIR